MLRLKALTWNIHGCVGGDGRHDVDRVGACVNAMAPDIAAFQEVDSRRAVPGAGRVYDTLRAQVGAPGHAARSIPRQHGPPGHILPRPLPLEEKPVPAISPPAPK